MTSMKYNGYQEDENLFLPPRRAVLARLVVTHYYVALEKEVTHIIVDDTPAGILEVISNNRADVNCCGCAPRFLLVLVSSSSYAGLSGNYEGMTYAAEFSGFLTAAVHAGDRLVDTVCVLCARKKFYCSSLRASLY